MSGAPRARERMHHAALGVAVVVAACMPARVEVGRDSTLDVFTAGEAGARGLDAPSAPSSAGAAGADGGQAGEAPSGSRASGGAGTDGSAVTGGAPSSDAAGSSGLAEPLCPGGSSPDAAFWPLDTFCRTFGCASSVEAAKLYLLSQYSECSGLSAEVSAGCGQLLVGISASGSGDVYLFEGDPPALVGASIRRAEPFGPCDVDSYFGGVLPNACSDATTCTFCGPEATCER